MKRDRNALKAGIFILISALLIIGLIVGIKGLERIFEPMQIRTADFALTDDLGGLNVGDDVRIGGYRVGVVRSIQVALVQDDQPPRIIVTFSLPRKYHLREGAHLAIQGTLTGSSWLNFESLGSGAPLGDDQPLAGNPGRFAVLTTDLSTLMPRLNALVDDVRTRTVPKTNRMIDGFARAADTTRGVVDDVHKNLPMILERYRNVADRAAEMMAEIRDLLGDTRGDFRQTMANLNQGTGTFKDKLPGALDKIDSALTGINSAMDDLQATLANAHGLSESAKVLVGSNRGRIDAMIRSLKTTADNLRLASAEIRRSPWRLLYKPQPGEMANLNLFDAAREFAEGARALDDVTQSLQAALKDPAVDETQLKELMEEVQLKADQYRALEQKLWDAVKE